MTAVGTRSERAGRARRRCSLRREVQASSARPAVARSLCKLRAARLFAPRMNLRPLRRWADGGARLGWLAHCVPAGDRRPPTRARPDMCGAGDCHEGYARASARCEMVFCLSVQRWAGARASYPRVRKITWPQAGSAVGHTRTPARWTRGARQMSRQPSDPQALARLRPTSPFRGGKKGRPSPQTSSPERGGGLVERSGTRSEG